MLQQHVAHLNGSEERRRIRRGHGACGYALERIEESHVLYTTGGIERQITPASAMRLSCRGIPKSIPGEKVNPHMSYGADAVRSWFVS